MIIYTRVGWYIYSGQRELNRFRSPDTEVGPEILSSIDSDIRTLYTETTGESRTPSSNERIRLEHSDIPRADSAVRAYTKYAMTFFLAMLITWVCFNPVHSMGSALIDLCRLDPFHRKPGVRLGDSGKSLYIRTDERCEFRPASPGLLELCHLHRCIVGRGDVVAVSSAPSVIF